MRVLGFYNSKRYLQRVLISIMLSMVLVMSALSIANTFILERSVKSNQEVSNLKVLTQIQYNLSYMNEIITHLSTFVYRDNILIPMMFETDLPKMDLIRGYQRLNTIMQSSSFLHSIVIYNYSQNKLYGTTTPFLLDEGVTEAKIRQWLLDPSTPHKNSRLIPLSLEKEAGQIDAFAFIVANSLDMFNRKESAIILYIKSDWVFESLEKMNVGSGREMGEIYISDDEGKLYSSRNVNLVSSKEDQMEVKRIIDGDKRTMNRQSGFVIGDVAGQKSMVTYMDDSIRNWKIVYIQSYDKLMEDVREIRFKSLMISLIFLLISIALSIGLSYKLYHPIENMLQKIRLQTPDKDKLDPSDRDEFHLMSNHYTKLTEKLYEISSEQIVNKYYIRKFLMDSQMFSHNDMKELIEKHDLSISTNGEILICVLQIDHYSEFERNTTGATKQMYSFAILNIAQEMMEDTYPCEAVEIRGDHVVLIVSRSDKEAGFQKVQPIMRDIQNKIHEYYSLSLSCGISDTISQFPYIASAYIQAMQLILYRIVKGNKAIITSENVKANLSNKQVALPDYIEKKLSEALKKGHMSEAGSELENAFSILSEFHYVDMLRAVSNLSWIIKNTAAKISSNRIVQFDFDMDYILNLSQEKETLEEMHGALLSVCAQICGIGRPATMERNDMILEAIKELIEQKYSDINLSQQSIAANVKLSSAYIGKLFKDGTTMSITEYINDIRLRHAQELLENDKYTILEIMGKCGYSNSSYFFRLFKAMFGSTPKEYRMKNTFH
ncbi:MAG: AraC family transcriptional regulator [Gorillibacterium sp.]|nr:AraC family transcriptional regulator [Gorillibacterium sp.]